MTDREREIEKALKPFESDGLKGAAEEARLGQTRMRNALLKKILPSPAPDCREANGLLPCPFCGSQPATAVLNTGEGDRARGCKIYCYCGTPVVRASQSGFGRTTEEAHSAAIAAWNRRPAAGGGETNVWRVKGRLGGETVWLYEQDHSGSHYHWSSGKDSASFFTDKAKALEGADSSWEHVSGIELVASERRRPAASTQAPAPVPALTEEVVRLVIAARTVAFGDMPPDPAAIKELDAASEGVRRSSAVGARTPQPAEEK